MVVDTSHICPHAAMVMAGHHSCLGSAKGILNLRGQSCEHICERGCVVALHLILILQRNINERHIQNVCSALFSLGTRSIMGYRTADEFGSPAILLLFLRENPHGDGRIANVQPNM